MNDILTIRGLLRGALTGAACLLLTASALGAQAARPAGQDESADTATTAPQNDDHAQDAPPSLDELLGIEDDGEQDTATETALEQHEKELQQALAEKEFGDAFHAAIDKMQLSAQLLDVRYDSGLGTQRVQEEILQGLDLIIDQAKKMMSQQMQQSSSSSSQQQQQQQQKSPGPQQQQPQNQQANGNNERPKGPQESNAVDGPELQQGDINTVIEESRTEWGSLPERIRDELYQGRQEKFSSIYDRLTREYYKRLAEDSSP